MNSTQIKAEINKLQAQLKEQQTREKIFYIIDRDGVVEMRSAEELPRHCAHWVGEKGNKSLKTEGKFVEYLSNHAQVSGRGCIRITPLLKEMGYKFDGKTKTWNMPEAEAETVVEGVNPLV